MSIQTLPVIESGISMDWTSGKSWGTGVSFSADKGTLTKVCTDNPVGRTEFTIDSDEFKFSNGSHCTNMYYTWCEPLPDSVIGKEVYILLAECLSDKTPVAIYVVETKETYVLATDFGLFVKTFKKNTLATMKTDAKITKGVALASVVFAAYRFASTGRSDAIVALLGGVGAILCMDFIRKRRINKLLHGDFDLFKAEIMNNIAHFIHVAHKN